MNYKYKKNQIFGKRLKVPASILKNIYNCNLSFDEFIEYELEDKIPISCVKENDRLIVERFGLDKAKKLDWKLINGRDYYSRIDYKKILMSIDASVQDVNASLYESVKDLINPSEYSEKMKEFYSDRLFNSVELQDEENKSLMLKFNEGIVSLRDLINHWELYKDKDLNYCLLKDKLNQQNIKSDDLKHFMSNYEQIVKLLPLAKEINIYSFVNNIQNMQNSLDKDEYVKNVTDSILEYVYNNKLELSNEQYQEIFKYSSMEDYLKMFGKYYVSNLFEELKTLESNYIFNIPIPFSTLCNSDVLQFIGIFGLKNVVDFDNECGQFFTKNDCEMLKLMNEMYMHYANNEHDLNKNIYTVDNGKNVYKNFSKDQFYESMRRMIIYGPSAGEYSDKAPDYRDIVGEFRVRNDKLFISEEAPEELKKLFYNKSITPQIISEHPEFIPFLENKNLESCFKLIEVKIEESQTLSGYNNFYEFLLTNLGFNNTMNFITEYSELIPIIFDSAMIDRYKLTFSVNDDINKICYKVNECIKKIILENRMPYPKKIPRSFIANYPMLFLSSDSPKELQDAFYNRKIDLNFLISNPDYIKYLKNVDFQLFYNYMPVTVTNITNVYETINLVEAIKNIFGLEEGFNLLLLYGKYIESVFEKRGFTKFNFKPDFSKDQLLDEIDKRIASSIIAGEIVYSEDMPSHFKNNNPSFFLSETIDKNIRDKFYNRQFSLEYFAQNQQLIEIIGDTNICCGFPVEMSWLIDFFDDISNQKLANYNRLKIISAYSKIKDNLLKDKFKNYIISHKDNFDIDKVDFLADVLQRLSLSNSSEIYSFRTELAEQIMASENSLETLDKIENIFIKNAMPTIGKIYSCFETLHPDFEGFDFLSFKISPVLKKASTSRKKVIVFTDLVKANFGSNNRNVKNYLNNIEISSKLYNKLRNGQIQYEQLSDEQKNQLIQFRTYLSTLYNSTMKSKQNNESFQSNGDVLIDILELSKKLSPNGTLDYNLEDRVVKMFCGFAGIDTLEQAKQYIYNRVKEADARNREAGTSDMILEQGDFVKGIGDIKHLGNILQNGSISKEYLGASSSSDATPLDTDVSMIIGTGGTVREKIESTQANTYGPIYFILKNDDRFINTRNNADELTVHNDLSKLEVFYTGVMGPGHYGIRTGFASSDINYIVMENYDDKVGLEIAMNGFYIPVANKDGKIVFTPKDYDNLRKKMNGLSYYDMGNYVADSSIYMQSKEIMEIMNNMESNKKETLHKGNLIKNKIQHALSEAELSLKKDIDLNAGSAVLFNTGSTGRFTNIPGDGDFDYIMQIDRELYSSKEQMDKLRKRLINQLSNGKETTYSIVDGDIRELKTTVVDNFGNKYPVEIDITFTQKTDKTEYASDVCIVDRFNNMVSKEEQDLVKANIIYAKKFLKSIEAYKPARKFPEQGGLGGIGVENWILQNGGSFYSAAVSYVEAADKCETFEQFKKLYSIPNFGSNHMADKKGFYLHDNYLDNMNEIGYEKMLKALKEYLKTMQMQQEQTDIINKQM